MGKYDEVKDVNGNVNWNVTSSRTMEGRFY